MNLFDKEWAKSLWKDPLYRVEILFRFAGVILMVVGLLKVPFSPAYFYTGVFCFGFALFVRKKRFDSYKN
jgi:hypothetical protein